MPKLTTSLNPTSETYQANREANVALLTKLQEALTEGRDEGKQKYIDRARANGKLTARERIDLLLDPGAPFLEVCTLAGHSRKGALAVGGTLVGGIGLVSGRMAAVIANVPTIKGGTIDEVTLQKGFRLNQIVRENRLPVIYLVESGGANLEEQANIFNLGGINFREITERSRLGLPTISVVFGNSTAGGAYIPGMSDYVIMVREQANVFLAGPPLVKMATGEASDAERLGGAEMHARTSGVADYQAADEPDALRLARELTATLPAPELPGRQTPVPPALDSQDLLGLLPADIRQPFDMHELIGRLVDGSEFTPFKPDYGETLVAGWAHLHGWPVGILANNGVLFSESAQKGTQFIQLCNRRNIPLVFLHNITGFMVGAAYEQGGIIKHGAHMINAVSNSTVPALTVIVGASYGAGNYAMCGRAYNPRFLFAYPNSKIAVMGGEQLAGVMDIIRREAAAKQGQPYDEDQSAMIRQMVEQQMEQESNAFFASGQLWDDGIIDPRETRTVLGFCLEVVNLAGFEGTGEFGVFRM